MAKCAEISLMSATLQRLKQNWLELPSLFASWKSHGHPTSEEGNVLSSNVSDEEEQRMPSEIAQNSDYEDTQNQFSNAQCDEIVISTTDGEKLSKECSSNAMDCPKDSNSNSHATVQIKNKKSNGKCTNKKRKLATDSHETKQFKCEHCVYATSHKGDLDRHILTHSDERPFKCEICARGFKQKGNLNSHKISIHANLYPFQCSICRKGFAIEQTVKLHEKDCKRKRYECSLCKFTYIRKIDLEKHMCKHGGEKPFKCVICGKRFTQKVNLNNHMRSHANLFTFHCSICRKGFNQESEKNSHEQHCNTKLYECYLCKYDSLHKGALIVHMRQHNGIKPFHCSHCPERFTQNSNLKIHIKRYHTQVEGF